MSSATQMFLFGSQASAPSIPVPVNYPASNAPPARPSVPAGQPSILRKTAQQQPVSQTAALQPGRCRFCRCTGSHVHDSTGERCEWVDDTRTCCDAEACMQKLAAERNAAPAPRPPQSAAPKAPSQKKKYRAPFRCGHCASCCGRAPGRCHRAFGGR